MKMDMKKLSQMALIFVGLVLVVHILREFQGFVRPLVLALVLSFLFLPSAKLGNRKNVWEIAKIMLSFIVLIVFFIFIGYSVVVTVSGFDLQSISNADFEQYLTINVMGHTISLSELVEADKVMSTVSYVIQIIIQSISSFVSEFFLIILFLIFLLPAQKIWIHNHADHLSRAKKKNFFAALQDIESGIREYLRVKFVISLGTAIVSLLVMLLFGVDSFLLFALLIFLFNFIPNIGSIIAVGIILIAQLVFAGFGWQFLLLAVLLIAIQVVFGSIVEPKFAGKRLNISPLIVLISLFFWGIVWGVGGMLFAVPLTLGIKIVIKYWNSG